MPAPSDPDSASLTLAVPYYSNVDYLLRTVESIAAQDHPSCAVLVADDSPAGLTPSERERLLAALERRFPVRIVRSAGAEGMASNWNRCLDGAETDLVTIVHGDDELTPRYASEMVRLAARHPEAAALFCGTTIIDASGRERFSFPDWYKQWLIPRHDRELRLEGDAALHSLLRGNYIFCPTLCYRHSRLGEIRFDARFRMVLDFDLVARLLIAGESLVGIPKVPLYRYRRHDENATAVLTRDLTRFREELAFYDELAERCAAHGFERARRTAEARRIVTLNLLYCAVRDVSGLRFADAAAKIRLLRG